MQSNPKRSPSSCRSQRLSYNFHFENVGWSKCDTRTVPIGNCHGTEVDGTVANIRLEARVAHTRPDIVPSYTKHRCVTPPISHSAHAVVVAVNPDPSIWLLWHPEGTSRLPAICTLAELCSRQMYQANFQHMTEFSPRTSEIVSSSS